MIFDASHRLTVVHALGRCAVSGRAKRYSPALSRLNWGPIGRSRTGIEKHQYFHVLMAVNVERLIAASAENPARFVGQFRDLLTRSVRLHLASDVPLTTMCNGPSFRNRLRLLDALEAKGFIEAKGFAKHGWFWA